MGFKNRRNERWSVVTRKRSGSIDLLLALLLGLWLGVPSAVCGQSMFGLSFDGKDDFVGVPLADATIFKAMTTQAWVYPESYDGDRETFAGWVRAVDQLPPKNGYTKTSYSNFLLYQNKSNWRNWGFYVCTNLKCVDVPATVQLPVFPNSWMHVAATYDSSITEPNPNIFLYLNGQPAGDGRVEGTEIPGSLSLWFGRWVAAIVGDMGMVAIHDRALDGDEIKANFECGPSKEGLFGYWPMNEGTGHIIRDESTKGQDGYLGIPADGDGYEPMWVAADYLQDTDSDGFADACDTCPSSYDPDQVDRDKDGAGDVCDDCSAEFDVTGDQCSFASLDISPAINGLLAEMKFKWGSENNVAPNVYMVPQDCENTVLACWKDGQLLPANCLRPSGYMLTVAEGENIPGGDLILYKHGDTTTIRCDLLRWYDLEAFANGAECVAIHTASTYDRDYNWATGECSRLPCIEPDEAFPYGKEFVGSVTSEISVISPIRAVPVNIKTTSFPNSINLSGGGSITVGIYTKDDFDATKVKPDTVRLIDRMSGGESCPPWKSEIRDLYDTLCENPDDIGACNPDERPDLYLFFTVSEACMPFRENTKATVSGETYDGATVIGFDNLIVR